MAQIETWLKSDISRMIDVNKSPGYVFYQDSGANLVGVEVTDDGQAATLQGSVAGSIITASGETLTVVGTKQGNRAWIVLPDDAYEDPGPISIFIKLTNDDAVTTIGALEGNVYKG